MLWGKSQQNFTGKKCKLLFMYFPLRELLKDLLENQSVTLPVNEERDPASISDICDGNL